MKKTVKFLSVIMSIILSATVLFSCGGNGNVNIDDITDTFADEINTFEDRSEQTDFQTTIEQQANVPAFSDASKVKNTAPAIAVTVSGSAKASLNNIPAFGNKAYVEINGNKPGFGSDELTTQAFERYSNLDSLGRCGTAYACLGKETMPTDERGEIGQVKPSGWHTIKYDCVDGKYLYNRCHLIGWQLSGENANKKNLITGTRYMNTQGMLPFENMVADYIKETNNHVLYRVTPIFEGKNLVASGVQIEAYSVEDNGDGICFNVYCYNNQPGVVIDYATGDSRLSDAETTKSKATTKATTKPAAKTTTKKVQKTEENNDGGSHVQTYILNTNTKKFHYPNCSSVGEMKDKNKWERTCTREEIIDDGYVPCKRCNP